MGNCHFRNTLPLFEQVFTGVKFTLVDSRKSSEEKRKTELMHKEPRLYPTIVNNKIRERLGAQVFQFNGKYESVDQITQK